MPRVQCAARADRLTWGMSIIRARRVCANSATHIASAAPPVEIERITQIAIAGGCARTQYAMLVLARPQCALCETRLEVCWLEEKAAVRQGTNT
jgi:hypothetical protein